MKNQENQRSGQQPFLQNLLSSQDLQEKLMQDCSNAALNFARAFIRASRKDLEKINTQDLSEFEFIALMIDGVEIAERSLIVVLGITPDCQKIPQGIREGDTDG